MNRIARLQGLGVAMVTPFCADGSVDRVATERLVAHLLDNKVDFLVVLGTTGEAPTLSAEEQKAYVRHVIELAAGRVPIVVGKSGNNTGLLVKELAAMECEGIDYILSAVPSYNKPTQKGIYEHFKAVAGAAKRPVILYNVPGRTGMNMTAETTLRIAHEVRNVAGVKEACGNMGQMARIVAGRPEGFSVLSGDDELTLPLIALGGDGVISVVGNVMPRIFGELVHSALQNDCRAAATQHLKLLPLMGALFAENNPGGVKCALSHLGICANQLRLPLVPVSDELSGRLKEIVGQLR